MSKFPGGSAALEPTRMARAPRALRPGGKIALVSPSSPAEPPRLQAGIAELEALGFRVTAPASSSGQGYFASSVEQRSRDFGTAVVDPEVAGVIAVRGGYGSNYVLDHLPVTAKTPPVCLVGYSDLTYVQVFLWERFGWRSFYGPMVAAGFDKGAGKSGGYDKGSFLRAVGEARQGWELELQGEALSKGSAEGLILGGCLTMVQTTIGTPWQLNARDALLILEDRGMKPWQVDRALMHLLQAGVFAGVRGVILGDFPECAPPVPNSWNVADVCRRLLAPLGLPVLWGAPVGHTERPMLTLPLGVRARLRAEGAGRLEIMEAAVTE